MLVFVAIILYVFLHMCLPTCGLTYQHRTQSVVCICLQITALPTGNFWLCCFEVMLLLSDKQRAEQVLELADSSVQHVPFAIHCCTQGSNLKDRHNT